MPKAVLSKQGYGRRMSVTKTLFYQCKDGKQSTNRHMTVNKGDNNLSQ